MTKFDPAQIPWRPPWQPIPPDQGAWAAAALQREMSAGHGLFGRTVQAIGRRQDCDDLLFFLGESGPRFAVVHLTYARETRPEWPITKLFDTLEAWIEQCMIPDAQEFGSRA